MKKSGNAFSWSPQWFPQSPTEPVMEPFVFYSPEELGAILLLKCYAWMSEDCSVTSDPVKLATMTRLGSRWDDCAEHVLYGWELNQSGKRYYNKALSSDRAKAIQKSIKAKEAADARWGRESYDPPADRTEGAFADADALPPHHASAERPQCYDMNMNEMKMNTAETSHNPERAESDKKQKDTERKPSQDTRPPAPPADPEEYLSTDIKQRYSTATTDVDKLVHEAADRQKDKMPASYKKLTKQERNLMPLAEASLKHITGISSFHDCLDSVQSIIGYFDKKLIDQKTKTSKSRNYENYYWLGKAFYEFLETTYETFARMPISQMMVGSKAWMRFVKIVEHDSGERLPE